MTAATTQTEQATESRQEKMANESTRSLLISGHCVVATAVHNVTFKSICTQVARVLKEASDLFKSLDTSWPYHPSYSAFLYYCSLVAEVSPGNHASFRSRAQQLIAKTSSGR